MIPYKTSKDYKRFKELLDKGEKITVFFLHKSGYGTEHKIRKTAEKKYKEIMKNGIKHIPLRIHRHLIVGTIL